MKLCRNCHVEKPPDQFNRKSARCKPCQLLYNAEWRKANPGTTAKDRTAARAAATTKVCRDCGTEKPKGEFNTGSARCKPCQLVYVAAWQQANPDKVKRSRAKEREVHRDKRNADALARYHRLMAEDPERVRKQRLAYAKTEKGAIYNRLAAHKRRGVRYDAEAREYVALILKDPCVYCGGEASEVDHVTPITKGGTGHWSNLAPACRRHNAQKGDQSLLLFMLSLKQSVGVC